MQVVALIGEQVAPIFALAGMDILSPTTHEELVKMFRQAVSNESVAMIVISARYAQALKKEIDEVRFSKKSVPILEISSSKGDYMPGEHLMTYIKKSIGQA